MQRMATVQRPVDTGEFSALEFGAWKGLLRVHAELVRALDASLEADHGLPLTQFDVLAQISGAPGHRMRMCDLADQVLLSRSGLTRLVDRMTREGLLERCACEDDARGSFACLTPLGQERFAQARSTHFAAARTLFLDAFSGEELAQMAQYWERVLPGISTMSGDGCCGSPRP